MPYAILTSPAEVSSIRNCIQTRQGTGYSLTFRLWDRLGVEEASMIINSTFLDNPVAEDKVRCRSCSTM